MSGSDKSREDSGRKTERLFFDIDSDKLSRSEVESDETDSDEGGSNDEADSEDQAVLESLDEGEEPYDADDDEDASEGSGLDEDEEVLISRMEVDESETEAEIRQTRSRMRRDMLAAEEEEEEKAKAARKKDQALGNVRWANGWLKQMQPSPGTEYKKETLDFDEVPYFVDTSPWAWNMRHCSVSRNVELRWYDPPGRSEGNIVNRRGKLTSVVDITAENKHELVFRLELKCNQGCREAKEDQRPQATRVPTRLRAPKRGKEDGGARECEARMIFEVTLGQVKTKQCTVYHIPVKTTHALPKNGVVPRLSGWISRFLFVEASNFGMTKIRLRNHYRSLKEPFIDSLKMNEIGRQRLPQDKHFLSALSSARAKGRLHRDPLVAVALLVQRDPGVFVHHRLPRVLYSKPRPRAQIKPDEVIEAVLATPFTLEIAILYSRTNGVHIDSSWRNKTADRSPVTFVLTVDDNGHGSPIAACVSSLATGATYTTMLEKLRDAVLAHARKLDSGSVEPVLPSELHDRLLQQAYIISEDGWNPAYGMMDGDTSIRRGFLTAFPGTELRLCQYHIMRAIRSQLRSYYGDTEVGKQSVETAIEAFHECQRCDDASRWNEHYKRLERSITLLTNEGAIDGARIWARFDRYLQKEWFSPGWRRAACDYGLDPGSTRASVNNTNNFTERSFCVFDRAFLCARHNKRLDRLISIIVYVFFRHFEECLNAPPRVAAETMHHSTTGFSAWEDQRVLLVLEERLPTKLKGVFESAYIAISEEKNGRIDGVCGISRHSGRERCTCHFWKQTGKRCWHLWASLFLSRNGPASEYQSSMRTYQHVITTLKVQDQVPIRDKVKKSKRKYHPTREEELAEYFKVTKKDLLKWDFLMQDANNEDRDATDRPSNRGTRKRDQPEREKTGDKSRDADERQAKRQHKRRKRSKKDKSSARKRKSPSGQRSSASSNHPSQLHHTEGEQRGRPPNIQNLAKDARQNRRKEGRDSSPSHTRSSSESQTSRKPAGSSNPDLHRCWLNSLCAAFAFCGDFIYRLREEVASLSYQQRKGVPWLRDLYKHSIKVALGIDQKPLDNSNLYDLITGDSTGIANGQQEDPAYAFDCIMQQLASVDVSGVTDLFTILQRFHVRCPEEACEHSEMNLRTNYSIRLRMTTTQRQPDIRPWQFYDGGLDCPSCENHEPEAHGTSLITAFPEILVLQVSYSQLCLRYGHAPDLAEYLSLGKKPNDKTAGASYQLSSVVLRHGTDVELGHNSAVVKKEGIWYHVDDERVTVLGNSDEGVPDFRQISSSSSLRPPYPLLAFYLKDQTDELSDGSLRCRDGPPFHDRSGMSLMPADFDLETYDLENCLTGIHKWDYLTSSAESDFIEDNDAPEWARGWP